ncbi:PAS domain-containing sensor histidine kinase [Methylibium petroleiphilum]|uniref:PAS domain-containing sensor histidine kinase n=1 Tax=Methylibium petroleiphilum TaxID=105560 RepID=UPI001ACBABB2|nr:PAS domain-containing sensor histidine kinase [Methylibium petroleiphilum]MBN9206388.1 PAS domain S-box protein [Methylibium petroleiphilum]
MTPHPPDSSLDPPPKAHPRRLFWAWWKRQSPAHQDRFATFAPLLSVLLFLAAIITAFWYLRNEEFEREQESVKRDTEIAQQQIRLRLIENQEQLVRMAREVATRAIDLDEFLGQAVSFARERPEVVSLSWIDADQSVKARHLSPNHPADLMRWTEPSAPAASAAEPQPPAGTAAAAALRGEPAWAFAAARDLRQPVYSRPYEGTGSLSVFQVHVPLLDRSAFSGTLVAEYSVESLLRYFVPAEVTRRHAISLLDSNDRVLASSVSREPANSVRSSSGIVQDVALAPSGNGLVVRGQGWRTSIGLIGNTLFWMVVALSALTVWMLLGTWRHMRRRSQMQSTLITETNFRRAMENSMLTGMRAMDLEGRISYVNPAFCAMTGFAEDELIGRLPPFPHWPPDRMEENTRLLQQELQGRSPAGGIEVKIMRKDGTLFDSRMYVSPLIDAKGHQTGWMTSMTNITEAKRIRDQLSASHERFTTVLEGLEAAVSVLSVAQGELLFANRSYRLWFGADSQGHARLAGADELQAGRRDADESVDSFGGLPAQELTEASGDVHEVFVESLQKWFDVRARYVQWTDGRLAQMLIATDITARRRAEEQASHQAEKAQVTSRLVTMGEMASSVAHELNQPLTAITNYCNGMVSRVKSDAIEKDDLIAALEKTARQAHRAGQIIHRIRAFVKRSEPQRQTAKARDIVEDAVELAGIELKRRNVHIRTYVAQRLPDLQVDPILIEQVLLNLLKNSAEAIDNAKLPSSRRHIELRVVPKHTPEEGGVIEFSVRDNGPGVKEEMMARLYEAFFSTKPDGLGIGLSLCRSIVESHRGRIRAENLYNGSVISGCSFAFTLPVELPVPATEPPGVTLTETS